MIALAFTFSAGAQTRGAPDDASGIGLSAECRVPDSRLHSLAPLTALRAALEAKRPVKVLALGSSAISGFGSGSGPTGYSFRLEGELEKVMSGVDIILERRGLPGEIMVDSFERITAAVTENEPDLVIWHVGVNDVLAKAEIEPFTRALNEVLEWFNQHGIGVVLVEPPYTAALASDEHYKELIAAIQSSAQQNGVPLVLRSEAMHFLSQQNTPAAKDQFSLSDLGYRCAAEHVARTVARSLLQTPAPPPPQEADSK